MLLHRLTLRLALSTCCQDLSPTHVSHACRNDASIGIVVCSAMSRPSYPQTDTSWQRGHT